MGTIFFLLFLGEILREVNLACAGKDECNSKSSQVGMPYSFSVRPLHVLFYLSVRPSVIGYSLSFSFHTMYTHQW